MKQLHFPRNKLFDGETNCTNKPILKCKQWIIETCDRTVRARRSKCIIKFICDPVMILCLIKLVNCAN